MNFVSYSQFNADIAKWEARLPRFDAVCGVPRSGLIPAAYIALRRNIRLVSLESLLADPSTAIDRAPLRDNNPIIKNNVSVGNRLLIVDDSASNESKTFNELRQKLKNQQSLDITYGAVYVASQASKADLFFEQVPLPRLFEWNWFRNAKIKTALLDMDGVICEDWQSRPEVSNDPEFEKHVKFAKPLYVPQVPIRGIVTSRIEKYRTWTTSWLQQQGVVYDKLVMHPAKTPEERRAAKDHARRKANEYLEDNGAKLFIESSDEQAKEIHERTGKPVLATDTMKVYL